MSEPTTALRGQAGRDLQRAIMSSFEAARSPKHETFAPLYRELTQKMAEVADVARRICNELDGLDGGKN